MVILQVVFLEVCIKIVTSIEGGSLKLSINNIVQFETKPFVTNQEVINKCFESLDSITIQNPTDNAWIGEISVTKSGEKKDLVCISGCTGSKFSGKILVDGNGDAKHKAKSYCDNGNACTFLIDGKKNTKQKYQKCFIKY